MSCMDQEILTFRHYSKLKPFICFFASGCLDNFFTAKTKENINLRNHFFKGDPVIFGQSVEEGKVKIRGGHIIAITENESSLIISPDKTFAVDERREYERHPVSLSGHVRCGGNMENRLSVLVKDISHSGFRFYSEGELSVGENIEIDIYSNNNVLNFAALVVRKAVHFGRNEYGVQIIFRSKSSISTTKDLINHLLSFEKEIISRHLYKHMIVSNM